MRHGWFPAGCLFFAVILIVPVEVVRAGNLNPEQEEQGRWERLPIPGSGTAQVMSMVMEPGGTVWVLSSAGLHYWAGSEFRQPTMGGLDRIVSNTYLSSLVGGPDRGAYLTQPGTEDHRGKLYRLCDGAVQHVTDFYYDDAGEKPRLYVSRDGRLFNWGRRFLAVLADGQWKRSEARFGRAIICDTGGTVHFCRDWTVFTVSAENVFSTQELRRPGVRVAPLDTYQEGALLGDDRLIVGDHGYKGLFAYDLNTGEEVLVSALRASFRSRTIRAVCSGSGGSVLVVASDDSGRDREALYRVAPDGAVAEIAGSRDLSWDLNARPYWHPGSVLVAGDGAVWLSLVRERILRLRGDRLRAFGWEDGLALDWVNHLQRHPNGNVFAASYHCLYVYHPGEPHGAPPAEWQPWEEFVLEANRPIRDPKGHLWMFLEDQPGNVSRWDGRRWDHVAVPFEPQKSGRLMADDRGHLLVQMTAHPDGVYDIGPIAARRYEDMRDLLVAAVTQGVRNVVTDPSFQGCLALDGGRIWYGLSNYPGVYYYDGLRWDQLRMRDDVLYLYASPKYGMLFRTQGAKFYTYDRGQIEEVQVPMVSPCRWLLGAKGLQPLEPELLASAPGEYVPVEGAFFRKDFRLLTPGSGAEGADRTYLPGDALPNDKMVRCTWTPAVPGGLWSDGGNPYRVFAGRAFACDFTDSPLAGKVSDIKRIVDDAAGNVWVVVWRDRRTRAYRKRLDEFAISVGEVVAQPDGSVTIAATTDLPGLAADRVRLFWRVGDGPWQGGEPGGKVTVVPPEGGEHEVELLGMDPIGGATPRTVKVPVRPKPRGD